MEGNNDEKNKFVFVPARNLTRTFEFGNHLPEINQLRV